MELCKESDETFETLRNHLVVLNDYAVEIRYPDDWCEPSIDDTREAFENSQKVKTFVLEKLI